MLFMALTTKLCGANEAQRSLRPNERLVMRFNIEQDYLHLHTQKKYQQVRF